MDRDTGVGIGDGVFPERFQAHPPKKNLRRLNGRVGGLVNGRCQNGFHGLGVNTDTVGHHQFGLCGSLGRETGLYQTVKKGMGGKASGYGLAEVNEGEAID